MSAPETVFVDPRVAAQMNQDGGDNLVGYVRQDIYERDVRGSRGRETIVQIMSGPDDRLISLSSWGRVFALVSRVEDEPPSWELVAETIAFDDLDS